MGTGIVCGFLAAIFNSFGYLLNTRFLQHYKEEGRLLTYALVSMMLLSLPFMLFVVPFGSIVDPGIFALKVLAWVGVFMLGQGSFFIALRYFEASRLSSLLGLKIIVLAIIFMLFKQGALSPLQWIAIFVSAISAMMFNWSGAGKQNNMGWIFVATTLVMYSMADILETDLVLHMKRSGLSDLRSAFSVVFLIYPALGLAALPGMIKYRPTVDQFKLAMPYAAMWIMSQLALLMCFAKLMPVFGNVILATRGVFSVILGASLPLFGMASLDSNVSARKWLQRIIAALLMVAAIGMYSA